LKTKEKQKVPTAKGTKEPINLAVINHFFKISILLMIFLSV